MGDIDVLDVTNALLHSEVHCRRISANEIAVNKDANGKFAFPVQAEDWLQLVDSKNMTRTISKKCWQTDGADENAHTTEIAIKRKERRKGQKLSEQKEKGVL